MANGTIPCNRKAVTNFNPSNMTQTTYCYYAIEGNFMLISIVGVTSQASTEITLVSDFLTTFGKNMANRAYSYIWNSVGVNIQLLAKGNSLSLAANSTIPSGTNLYGQIIVPIT